MSLHLVTGHSGAAHITAADQGALNACLFGAKDYVLESGEKFAASVITNNQIRIADGELLMQGRHIRLARGTYEDLTIENGSQGMNRNDLIVVRYTKNTESGIESAAFAVIKGTETTGTATDPEYTTGDILSGDCTLHEMPLFRVPLTGITVGEVVPLFDMPSSNPQTALLWENASPASVFAAQTINLDLSEYDGVEIIFNFTISTTYGVTNSVYVPIGHSGLILGAYTGYLGRRRLQVMDNGVVFESGGYYKSYGSSTTTEQNEMLIPIEIYGIKGVQ